MGAPSSEEWGDRRLLREYRRLFSPYKRMFVGAIVCMLAAGAIEPLLPWLLGALLDSNLPSPAVVSGEWLPFVFFAVIIARAIFVFGRSYFVGWLETTIQNDLRRQASGGVLRWPPSRLMRASAGDVTSHIVFFTGGLAKSLMKILVTALQETVKLIGFLALLFSLNWRLALIIFVFAPPLALLTRYINRRVKKKSRQILSQNSRGVSRLNELVNLWRIIKSRGGREKEERRLRAAFMTMRNAELKRSIAKAILPPTAQILLALPFAYVIWRVTTDLQTGVMTPGDVAAFLSAMLLIQTPVRNVIKAFNRWAEVSAAARMVFSFIALPSERDAGRKRIDKARGELSFEGVSFSYDSGAGKALDGVTLSAAAGEVVALVGRSGAGKSTLAGLAPRFVQPTGGTARLDGHDVADIELASLRRQIAIVTQEPLLFDDTVAANVAYPEDGDADSARVMAALESADADEFVRALPGGVDAHVGANGGNLSGGQRQRLALARAFYQDAPVIIMDEATSAVDGESEEKIKRALRRLLKGKTALIITHRFSAIDFADRVAVLDGGRLVAVGAAAELEKTCPLFAELRRAQTASAPPAVGR